MGNSYLGRLLSTASGIIFLLTASNAVHAQLGTAFYFDNPPYTTTGGTLGPGSLVGQDGWIMLDGTPNNGKMAIVNLGAGAFSSTQVLKITVDGNTISQASKSFTPCATTTNTGLLSVRMKYKEGLVGPAGTIIKPIVLDELGNNFGFFQIYGNGMMKGRGGTATNVNTDEFDPDSMPGYLGPVNGWNDLEMRLNPSPNTIVDPATGISIPFGKLLYVVNGNVAPATGMTGAVPNENPMVYYGGANTSGKVGRLTFRYETTSTANESCYIDNWQVWSHPRPVAKAQPFTVQLNASGTATVTGANIDNGSFGGDPNQTITNRTANPSNFTCSNVGSNNVTLTVTQSDGQTATAVTTVTVQDTVAPNITSCGANQSTNANANCQGTVPNFTSAVTATDNCTATGSLTKTQSPTAGTVVNSGVTVVTVTVKDALNNESQCTRNFTVNAPDTDGDSTPDCSDNCDNDPNKIEPGLCGCGVPDTDTDGDSTPDCIDDCDNDPDKIAPGLCGCGVPEGTCERTITQWRSVRTHTGLGDLAHILNPTSSGNGTSGPSVETRGTVALGIGIRKIQVDFSGAITLVNPANISVVGRTSSGDPASMGPPVDYTPSSVVMADSDTMDILFNANQLPNETCYTITIGGGTLVETLTGDLDVMVRSLYCDTNSSGTVVTSDQLFTKSKAGQPVVGNILHDLNMSGAITSADQLAVKSQTTNPTKSALCP